jgi:hypothetical protein
MISLYLEVEKICDRCSWRFSVTSLDEVAQCPSCEHKNSLAERWKTIFESVLKNPSKLPEGGRQELSWLSEPVYAYWGRAEPTCNECDALLPLSSLSSSLSCSQCGAANSCRSLESPMQELSYVRHVIGERTSTTKPEPIRVPCPHCHAPIGTDGSRRELICGACLQRSQVPNDSWKLLNPNTKCRMFLLYNEAIQKQAAKLKPTQWRYLYDICSDGKDGFYCLGTLKSEDVFHRDEECVVWHMNEKLSTTWVSEKMPLESFSSSRACGLSIHPNGSLLIWQRGKHKLYRISSADGKQLEPLGGPEPEGSKVHQLDLEDCTALDCDPDGTLLACIHERLLRFRMDDGQGTHTWKPRSGLMGLFDTKPAPLYLGMKGTERIKNQSEGTHLDSLGDRPYLLNDSASLRFCQDGALYFYQWRELLKYDLEGNKRYRIHFGINSHVYRPDTDPSGNAFVIKHDSDTGDELIRILPSGKEQQVITKERALGGELGKEEHLVWSNNKLWLFDSYGKYRVLSLSGALLQISDESKKDDDEAQKRREKKRAE